MTTPTLWIGIQASNAAADETGDMAKKRMSAGKRFALDSAEVAKGNRWLFVPTLLALECVRSEGNLVGYGLVIARNVPSPYRLDSAELEPFRAQVKEVLAEHGITGPVDICVQPVDESYTVH